VGTWRTTGAAACPRDGTTTARAQKDWQGNDGGGGGDYYYYYYFFYYYYYY